MFLYPDINESFIIEGIVASIFIFMCSIGFILLYQASKFVYNKSVAVRYLAVGILLIFASFITLQAMITIKLGQKLFNV
jgi:divalent metal cation (Fe/Co/Zn/Cd) transporter